MSFLLNSQNQVEYDSDFSDHGSTYPTFLYKFGLILLPYFVSNPIYITQLFQQIQYSPCIKSYNSEEEQGLAYDKYDSLSSRLLEADQYLERNPQVLQAPQPLPVDSLGYVVAPKEKVIGTCVLEDGSLLSTVIISSKGLTTKNLKTLSLSSCFKVLSNTFGLGVFGRGLGVNVIYSITKSSLEKFISFNIDEFLFNTFLTLSDRTIGILSEIASKVGVSLLLLPVEVAKARLIIFLIIDGLSRVEFQQNKNTTVFSLVYLVFMQKKVGFIMPSINILACHPSFSIYHPLSFQFQRIFLFLK